jgi:hypothetical protein
MDIECQPFGLSQDPPDFISELELLMVGTQESILQICLLQDRNIELKSFMMEIECTIQ